MNLPSIDSLGLLLAFVWPGVLIQHVYRLIMPARAFEWKEVLSQGLFFSVVNYVLLFPIVLFVIDGENLELHAASYWGSIVLLLLVGPACIAIGYKSLHRWKWIGRWIQAPYHTAWDFFFDQRKPYFVLVHLRTGYLVGGYYGPGSYAAAYPNEGDLYLSNAVRVDHTGTFLAFVEGSAGLLIRKDEYSYLEFLRVPPSIKGVISDDRRQEERIAEAGDHREGRLPAPDGRLPAD
jgi:hypothetical protein